METGHPSTRVVETGLYSENKQDFSQASEKNKNEVTSHARI